MSTITKNFDKIWLQERSVVKVKNTTGAAYVDLYAGGSRLARYTFNNDRVAVIDLTDYLRAYPSTTSVQVQVAGETAQTIGTVVAGRICPEHLLLPVRQKIEGWTIAPPSCILQDIGVASVFECYGFATENDCEYLTDLDDVPNTIGSANTIQVGAKTLQIAEDHEVLTTINLKPLSCGKKYAAVEWVSASGVTRRHTFEVRSANSATSSSISLQTVDGSFRTLKGRTDGFSLYLECLTAYDLAYYSDVIFSSDVKISFDGSVWTPIDITSSSSTTPDGDAAFNKLEIAANYRQYDTI